MVIAQGSINRCDIYSLHWREGRIPNNIAILLNQGMDRFAHVLLLSAYEHKYLGPSDPSLLLRTHPLQARSRLSLAIHTCLRFTREKVSRRAVT